MIKKFLNIIGGILCIVLILYLGLFLFALYFNRWPFDLKKLDSFNDKTTIQEVKKTLGNPKSKSYKTNEQGEKVEEWIYSASGAWPIVYISFKPDGTYNGHETDY